MRLRCMDVHMHVHIHTYADAHAHTHTHTHAHARAQAICIHVYDMFFIRIQCKLQEKQTEHDSTLKLSKTLQSALDESHVGD